MLDNIVIDLKALNFSLLWPVMILVIFALAFLITEISGKKLKDNFYGILSILALASSLLFVLNSSLENPFAMFNLIYFDSIAKLASIAIYLAAILILILTLGKSRFADFASAEFYILFLFIIIGFTFMVSTDNLMIIFIGLETASLALYTLLAIKDSDNALAAAIKYFVLGSMVSGFYVFGCALLYLLSGSLNISTIVVEIMNNGVVNLALCSLALLFIFITLAFKLSLIPFHSWLPEIYENSNTLLASFIAVVPKMAAFVVFIRLFEPILNIGSLWLNDILFIIIIVTMTAANIIALAQKDVKRMLAFSSISHSGFVLSAIFVASTQANVALFTYWILFIISNVGAFGVLYATESKNKIWDKRFDTPYSKFAGLVKNNPFLAISMAIFMFSLAGIPPFAVFWGKFYIMNSAIFSEHYFLAFAMATNSAIAVYYYLKLVVYMFLKEPITKHDKVYYSNFNKAVVTAIALCVFLTIISPYIFKILLNSVTLLLY